MVQVGQREQRAQAAAMLSEMAEKGDSAAAQVILDNSQAYLVAMQHAGIFTGLSSRRPIPHPVEVPAGAPLYLIIVLLNLRPWPFSRF
jgi:hypothetical protein